MYLNDSKKVGRAIYKSTTNTVKYPRNEFLSHADSLNTSKEFKASFLSFKVSKD